jgi:hypothetical protein
VRLALLRYARNVNVPIDTASGTRLPAIGLADYGIRH